MGFLNIRSTIETLSLPILNDEDYAKKRFKSIFGRDLNIKKPVTFNEKLQWLKLFDRNPLYKTLADKYEVRKYVEDNVGSENLNEIFGVYSKVDDILFEKLPDSFVLKATHGSGWNTICNDKKKLNWRKERKKLANWLHSNYYYVGREWVYNSIKPRIICERYLEPNVDDQLYDYKFFCFCGEPLFIQVDIDRFADHTRCFYSSDWEKIPFTTHYPYSKKNIPKPEKLVDMIRIAKQLSSDIPFVRIDLYSVDCSVFFGEMTFYPGNGFEKFYPFEYDLILGNFLDLSKIKKG